MNTSLIHIRHGKAHLGLEPLQDEAMAEETEVEKPFPWSASRLKKLLQCPRQFRFAYIDQLPTVTTAPLAFGRAVHEAIKDGHETQMTTGELPRVSELLLRFDELWHIALEEDVLFRPSHPAPERYHTMGHEVLRVFHTVNHEARPPLAVELPFEVEVGGASEERFRLHGIIDRVDEVQGERGEPALVVVDYKSGSRKIKVEEAKSDLQLTLYALVLGQMFTVPVERVEFHWLRDGMVLSATRDEAALRHLIEEVLPYADSTLKAGEFAPRPGYWCRWCDFEGPCRQEGGGVHGVSS